MHSLFLTLACIALSALGGVAGLGGAGLLQSVLESEGIEYFVQGEPGYQNASRPFNLRLHFEPVAVAYPSSTEDVSVLVEAAALLGIAVNARSGGHSYAGYGLGGVNGHLVIDLSKIKEIKVDQNTGTAVVGAGNRLGDIAIALFDQGGRAIPHGTCPLVGIGGHASFGGFGVTSRSWGLTLDNVVAATVVLANGTIVQASDADYPDLFWALRGAAPSFVIITHFHFRTYPAPAQPTFFSYEWSLPLDQAIKGISTYQNFTISAPIPKELGVELRLEKGRKTCELLLKLSGSYYGSPQNFAGILTPFLDTMPAPLSPGQINVTSWLQNLQLFSSGPLASTPESVALDNNTFYAKSLMTPSNEALPDEAITALARWLSVEGWYTTTAGWYVQLQLWGGATSQVVQLPTNATAYSHRDILWDIQAYASSSNHEPPYPKEGFAFLDGVIASITANVPETFNYGSYPNYADPRLPTPEWQELYYGTNLDRLQQIKTELDPGNVFRWPQSIPLLESF
ncbi:hypothetical protein FOMPIDRAFT_90150 [Fomitopsis schrenkii]|uniref:FAD-binding PCMH-type domain-containing protein n=1 Tax=Fomitopsis schrenkii TaxID=2126942 RepID=S8FJ82_FOMSC|nr:hypothetical protein FOMPIDRAFT_90150 [Fomitopsis schrenkii]